MAFKITKTYIKSDITDNKDDENSATSVKTISSDDTNDKDKWYLRLNNFLFSKIFWAFLIFTLEIVLLFCSVFLFFNVKIYIKNTKSTDSQSANEKLVEVELSNKDIANAVETDKDLVAVKSINKKKSNNESTKMNSGPDWYEIIAYFALSLLLVSVLLILAVKLFKLIMKFCLFKELMTKDSNNNEIKKYLDTLIEL